MQQDGVAILAAYHRWLMASYAEKSVKNYYGYLTRFLIGLGKPVVEITEDDCAGWIEQFPYRSAGRRAAYQAMSLFFSWAHRNDHVFRNPMKGIPVPPIVKKEPRALSPEQLQAVLVAARRRSLLRYAAIVFLYYSGVRVGELTTIRWEDLRHDGILIAKTKTGEERVVPWNNGLREAVEIFRDRFGDNERILPRSGQTVWLWCVTAGNDAGIERVHPHLFRSTTATTMLNRGGRLQAVKSVLGHSNIKTTSRYLADDAEDREAAVQLL